MLLPLVRLGDPWPTGPAHPSTGWAPPVARVRLATGLSATIDEWGDAVPGGYNGSFRATDPRTGVVMGQLDYQSAAGGDPVLIAMIEVTPSYRGRGVADLLLARLLAEFPGRPIEPGLMTESGGRWWARVEPIVRRTRQP